MAFCQPKAVEDHSSPISPDDSGYRDLIDKLTNRLKELGLISKVEYVGSLYKGTYMVSSDRDNLLVKCDDTITVVKYPKKPEYAFLSRDGQLLHPRDTLNMLKGKIQKVLNDLGLADKVVLADHGPAIELRYYSGGREPGAQPNFCVDLVFCYEVNTGQSEYIMYTAKQPFDCSDIEILLWKQSTALEEIKMMSEIDENNTCCRWAIRIMKALKDKEATLQVLTSYVFEQVLFGVCGQKPTEFWKDDKEHVMECVRLLLQKTADGVDAGFIPNHFNPVENVLRPMDDVTKGNVVNRLKRIARDPVLERVLKEV